MIQLLGYIPFLQPLNVVHDWWYLLILPLAFGLSMVYKALRVPDFQNYWRQVVMMTLQIILGLAALAIALFVLVQVVIPALPAD